MSGKSRKTAVKKAAAAKVAKGAKKEMADDANPKGTGAGQTSSRRAKSARADKLPKQTDDATKVLAEESPSAPDEGAGPSPATSAVPLNVQNALRSAGLGGVLQSGGSLSTLLANLYASQLHRKQAARDERGGVVDDGSTPQPSAPTQLVPLSPEWKKILSQLFADQDFDPRERIGGLLRHDPVRVLAHLPFELRGRAATLYRRGYRVFGKVPCRPVSLDASGCITPRVIDGTVRPISCPEPAGEGRKFAIAWLVGNFWEYECDELDEIDELIGSGLKSELHRLREYMNTVERRLAEHRGLAVQEDTNESVLSDVDCLVRDLAGIDDQQLIRLVRAFRAGVTYTLRVQFSQATRLYEEWACSDLEGWQSIITHALIRHGKDTDRKTLLTRIGCLNVEEFHKTSKTVLRFGWRYAPVTNGVNFDKSFGEAIREVRRIDRARRGQSDGIADNRLVAATLENHQRNAGYRKRTDKTNEEKADLKKRRKADRMKIRHDASPDLQNESQKAAAKTTQEQNRRAEEALKRWDE